MMDTLYFGFSILAIAWLVLWTVFVDGRGEHKTRIWSPFEMKSQEQVAETAKPGWASARTARKHDE
jgi:hypothetical protein